MVASEDESNLKMVMCVIHSNKQQLPVCNPFSREKSSINRDRLILDGKMAKAHGSHSVFGIPYEVNSASTEDIHINNEDNRLAIHTDLRDRMSFFTSYASQPNDMYYSS